MLMTRHGKCTLTPKNVPTRCPIVTFSYHYEIKIVSVILLQNQKYDLSNIFDKTIYGGVKNGMLYSENAKIINM